MQLNDFFDLLEKYNCIPNYVFQEVKQDLAYLSFVEFTYNINK